MPGSPNNLNTRHLRLAFASRTRPIESGRLGAIVTSAQRLGANSSISRFLTRPPASSAGEYLPLLQAYDQKRQELFSRTQRREILPKTRLSTFHNNDKSNLSRLIASHLLDATSRPTELGRIPTHGVTTSVMRSALNSYEKAKLFSAYTFNDQSVQQIICRWPATPRNLFSRLAAFVSRLFPTPSNRQLPTNCGQVAVVTSNDQTASNDTTASSVGNTNRPLIKFCQVVTSLIQPIPSTRQARTAQLTAASSNTLNAPIEHLLLENRFTTGRTNGFRKLNFDHVSSPIKFIEGPFADQRVSRNRLNSIGKFKQLHNVSRKLFTSSAQVSQWFGRLSPLPHFASVHPNRIRTYKAPSSGANGEMSNPVVITFSPTVVIHNQAEHGNLEGKVVEAIRRHSYELVRLISRELQTQRRAFF